MEKLFETIDEDPELLVVNKPAGLFVTQPLGP